jgi:Na+-transporting NADH:ubiquinone oxidoreductase subunit NqrB
MAVVRQTLPRIDPRYFQIAALGILLFYGCGRLGFDIGALQITVTLTSAVGMQLLLARLTRADKAFDVRSALITGLSLCLLLRTNIVWFAALAVAAAILSKFIFRFRGKHLFNPANFGLVVLLLAGPRIAWCSAGQWGSTAVLTFFFVCVGLLVVNRARRADISLVFLAGYALLLFARSAMLGEPWTIPWHRLQSGALLLFAFFMISDPRSTPNSWIGRAIFASLVVLGAGFIQFGLNRPNGLFLSLAGFSLLVPLLDFLFPAARYEWSLVGGRARGDSEQRRHQLPGANVTTKPF